jgi:hypothetical protein
VARYVSLERMVEESKARYYEVLAECSRDWQQGRNEIVVWWNFLLSILRRAYKEFESRIEAAEIPAKAHLARDAAMNQDGPFTLAEIAAQCPSVSPQMIKKVLAGLKKDGLVQLTGRGRSARWVVIAPSS